MKKILFSLFLIMTNLIAAATSELDPDILSFCEKMQMHGIGKKAMKSFRKLSLKILPEMVEEVIENKDHPAFQAVMNSIASVACKSQNIDDICAIDRVLWMLFGPQDNRVKGVRRHLIQTTIQSKNYKNTIEIGRYIFDSARSEKVFAPELEAADWSDGSDLVASLLAYPLGNAQEAKMGLAFFIHFCDPADEKIKEAEMRCLAQIPEEERCPAILDAYLGYSLMGHDECICCLGAGWQFGKRRHHVAVDYLLTAVLKSQDIKRVRQTLNLVRSIFKDAPPPEAFAVAALFVGQYGEKEKCDRDDISLLEDIFGKTSVFTQTLAQRLVSETKNEERILLINRNLEKLEKICDNDSPIIQELSDYLTNKVCLKGSYNDRESALKVLTRLHGAHDPRVLRVARLLYANRPDTNTFGTVLTLSQVYDKESPQLQFLVDEMMQNSEAQDALKTILAIYGPQDSRAIQLADVVCAQSLVLEKCFDMIYPLLILKEMPLQEKSITLEEHFVRLLAQEVNDTKLLVCLTMLSRKYADDSVIIIKLMERLVEIDELDSLAIYLMFSQDREKDWYHKLKAYLIEKKVINIPVWDCPWGGYTINVERF